MILTDTVQDLPYRPALDDTGEDCDLKLSAEEDAKLDRWARRSRDLQLAAKAGDATALVTLQAELHLTMWKTVG